MSLLRGLGDKALNTAKLVGNKSQEAVEVGKIKLQISQIEGDIKKLKLELGEVVYTAYANESGSPSEEVVSLCSKINERYSQIDELKQKIV